VPDVVISFLDGEVLYAETPDIVFDLPVLEAEVRNVDHNSERAILPVSAIRQLIVGDPVAAPDQDEVAQWDRAAFHFTDGHVLRAQIAPDVLLGRYGGVWDIVEPDSDEMRTLAIPYTALKGVFQVRHWDGRKPGERSGAGGSVEQLAKVMATRESQSVNAPRKRAAKPLMSRIRRNRKKI